ncbi:molybdenum cofactor guanylyltransferase [Mycobacterium sp. CVI_P3]|uniref:Probable molybdenum cofactor guanylyltransferase n=1 Tax=Mycobacterium pinniadriaticum TaxID=2994102 RepID=A0ABT3SD88_9MYCO|nr:molybdenum cofactor guanylyltransferase [Mycobacterium pinniadriaticum]MCX2931065.1 molybdenum cofactor guanylyltransferase [Mycobacterium pinniadriaticum]MCX2937489.1 molybdenum cofactor guanylyltransferase [Mycobacterium pinniadriaticum]
MSTPAPLAAVVLAGGASRRMGRDKATLPHPDGGVTMVEYTVGVLRSRCAPVFVIAAPGQALPALNAEVLRDEVRGVGPLLATGRGLRAAAAAGLERAFVSAVDMPFLTVDVIDELAEYSGVDIVLPWDSRDHYLAGIYRTDLADHIDALVAAGERSMRALAETVVTQRVVLPAGPALANVNSPADLQQQIAT